MSEVRALTPEDKGWVSAVWKTAEADIGSWGGVGSRAWFFFWRNHPEREFWIGVEPFAFAHYRLRARDRAFVLDEVAVAPEARRRGHARELVEAIGRPLQLKTDASNEASNALYRKLGFARLGSMPAKSNSARLLHVYLLS